MRHHRPFVAGVLAGRSERKVTIHLLGGDLQLLWSEKDNHVYMTGPAVEVFSGDWPDDLVLRRRAVCATTA